VSENLLERIPVNLEFGTGSAFADLTGQHAATIFGPFLHIGKHPDLLLSFIIRNL
jgi:hypothetical protein